MFGFGSLDGEVFTGISAGPSSVGPRFHNDDGIGKVSTVRAFHVPNVFLVVRHAHPQPVTRKNNRTI